MMMCPPSDRALLEKLEQLQSEHTIGIGLRPEVFRAAIALAARDCGHDCAFPIDKAALDFVFEASSSRMAAGGGEEEPQIDSSELFVPDVFGPPPEMPNLRQLRGTVLFWGGDEASMI